MSTAQSTHFSISRALPTSIFRAYDIRGIVDKDLDSDAIYTLGLALGSMALEQAEQTILVAKDGRLSGPRLLQALQAGIIASGCNVIDIGIVPTPVLYFATHTLGYRSGVMLTASHNPGHYNGLKMVINGNTLAAEAIQQLYQRIEQGQFSSGQGQITQVTDVGERYIARILSDVNLTRSLKVVLDCGNGVAGPLAQRLLTALNCEVIDLYCDIDGNFPNHQPDPSVADNLQDLVQAVKDNHADVGIAIDGDGDRIGMVTDLGEIVWADRQLMLYARDILTHNPGANIIYDVKCSWHLAQMITQHQGTPIMCRTGHSLVKAKMRETKALLAGEMSGHVFFADRWYGFDDGLYATARLLEILTKESRPCSQIFADDIPNSVNTPEIRVAIDEAEKFAFMQRFVAQTKFNQGEVTTIDGLRIDLTYGWGLVRASNTSPHLVLRFEADTEVELKNIQQLFREKLLAVDSDLDLPF